MLSYFLQLALMDELKQSKHFETVESYPLVALKINLVDDGIFFKEAVEKNTSYQPAWHLKRHSVCFRWIIE